MQESNERKILTGTVVSKSGDKSIKVAIDYKIKHPQYGKYVRRRTRFGVHDEHNQAETGDTVRIIEGRPYSKTKSWRLVSVLKKAVKEI